MTREKREAKLTDGGPSSSKQDDEAAAVACIIPAQMERLNNAFDDDNFKEGKKVQTDVHVGVIQFPHYLLLLLL